MPFDAGTLVATIKGDRTQLTRDLAAARQDFSNTGKAADAMGAAGVAAGTKTAAGARQASTAAKEQAASTKAAGAASEDAGSKGAAAGRKTADGAALAKKQLEETRSSVHSLGVGLTAYGAAAAGAFALAVKTSADYGAKMAQLQTLSGANAADMQRESQAAMSVGTAYGFTASQVADAEIELQKAGQGVTDQLNGGLKGALTLAAAGQMDVADATSIAVTTLTQFRLGADQTSHVADLLSAGSDKALGSVKDLGDGLKQGGLVASQMGLSVEDTVGTLSAFAQAGLIGSDAGTSFKTMLLSLQSPSSQAQKYLEKYNITAYDAQGNFVGITNLAGQLHDKLQGVSQAQRDAALSTIFGTDAIRAANVLYNEGDKGISKWISDVDDSGFAAQQAQGKLNSLNGDFTKLVAILQTDLIKAGAALDPILRPIVQVLTAAATAAGELPPPVLGITAATIGLTGAVALGTGALVLFLPRLLEFQRISRQLAAADVPVLSKAVRAGSATLTGFKGAASSVASFMGGPWGLALAAAGLAISAYQAAIDAAKASTDTLDAAAGRGAGGVDELVSAAARGENAVAALNNVTSGQGFLTGFDVESGVLDGLNKKLATLSQFRLPPGFLRGFQVDNIGALQDTLERVGESLARVATTDEPAAAQAFEALAKKTDGSRTSLGSLLDSMPAYRDALEAQATKQGLLTGKETDAQRTTKLLALANKEATSTGQEQASTAADQATQIAAIQGSAADANQSVSDLAKAIQGLGSTSLDARGAQREFQQAVDDAEASLKKNKATLDITTQAGRDNSDALDKIASSAITAASKLEANGASVGKVSGAIKDGRSEFIKYAEAMGKTPAQAKKLADAVGLIPTDVKLLIDTQGVDKGAEAAKAAAEELARQRYAIAVDLQIGNLDTALAKAGVVNHAQVAKNARLSAYAMGGRISGVDTGGDNQIAAVQSGEHVLTVSDVAAMGGHPAVYSFRRSLHGYATGGVVSVSGAAAEEARIQAQIDRQEKAVKTANSRAKKADTAASKASDASSAIYGKGTGSAKHAAAQRARELKKKADDAAKVATKAEKDLQALQDKLATAQSKAQDAEDLAIANQRGQYVDSSNPLGAVDLALTNSRNTNLSAAQRKSLDSVARTQNANLVSLAATQKTYTDAVTAAQKGLDDATTAQDNAKSSLDSLKDTFTSTVSSIASGIRGVFQLSNALTQDATTQTSLTHNAGTGAAWDEMVSTTVAGGTSVQAIRAQIDQSASSISSFAGQLQSLANMGYSSDVVTDVANLGVTDGSKVAAALLTAASDDVTAINAGYSSIAASSTAAGTTVANGQLGGQISAAQATYDAKTQAAADAQRALDAANANVASVNKSITDAQQAIVNAVTAALAPAKATTTKKAYGGIHDAQIQPAGANVLWAESDTGGEAYIPFAIDRRPRALAILNETARRLGQAVIPAGTAQRALGGITGTTTSYGGDVHNWNGPMFGTPDQIIAAAQRNAAAKKARANTANRIGRVNP